MPDKMKMIRLHYKAEMEKVFKLVLPDLGLSDFCLEPELHRFAWLSRFLCAEVLRWFNNGNLDVTISWTARTNVIHGVFAIR